ncbi:hypothetical protein AX14_011951, partial [Amanita brunnescens Koide BX004]
MRPLTLEQLAIVVTFDPSSFKFDSSLGLVHPDDVIQVCSSLVIKAANGTVQLAHASVKEYFLQKPRQISLSNTKSGHANIAHCCLEYLVGHKEEIFQVSSLSDYSTEFWPDHYKLSNKNEALQETVTAFLQAKDATFKTWRRGYYSIKQLDIEQCYADIPVNYAALLALEDITQRLIATNQWPVTVYGTTIHAAAKAGLVRIVSMLLDMGAEINANVGTYGNALHIASLEGHAEIVRLLLNKEADVNAPSGDHFVANPLQAALSKGNLEIVDILLDKGANGNAQGGKYGNALQTASNQGNLEIVNLLLDKGANVNAQGGKYGNALQ